MPANWKKGVSEKKWSDCVSEGFAKQRSKEKGVRGLGLSGMKQNTVRDESEWMKVKMEEAHEKWAMERPGMGEFQSRAHARGRWSQRGKSPRIFSIEINGRRVDTIQESVRSRSTVPTEMADEAIDLSVPLNSFDEGAPICAHTQKMRSVCKIFMHMGRALVSRLRDPADEIS
jgi:hypothetical protein